MEFSTTSDGIEHININYAIVEENGRKKGSNLVKLSESGGIKIFPFSVDLTNDWKALKLFMDNCNSTSPNVGKMIASCSNHIINLSFYVPESMHQNITAKKWCSKMISKFVNIKKIIIENDTVAEAEIILDRQVYAPTEMDTFIGECFQYLRENKLIPDEDSDDEIYEFPE